MLFLLNKHCGLSCCTIAITLLSSPCNKYYTKRQNKWGQKNKNSNAVWQLNQPESFKIHIYEKCIHMYVCIKNVYISKTMNKYKSKFIAE